MPNPRPEGVYASTILFPAIFGDRLIKIERICGDGSTKELVIAPSEARSLIKQLHLLLKP